MQGPEPRTGDRERRALWQGILCPGYRVITGVNDAAVGFGGTFGEVALAIENQDGSMETGKLPDYSAAGNA